MGDRRQSRELALKMLFQIDLSGLGINEVKNEYLDKESANNEVKQFAISLVKGTLENIEMLDKLIIERLQNWEFGRISNVDKNILRLASYELIFCEKIPVAVTMNEAIEITKDFSDVESSKFINGILDKIRKDKKIIKKSMEDICRE
jgi:N utilization substance protein B